MSWAIVLKMNNLYPASIYKFKVNNRNTGKRYETCLKLIIKTPELRHWLGSGVFIVNFEQNLHVFLVSLFEFKQCLLDNDPKLFLKSRTNRSIVRRLLHGCFSRFLSFTNDTKSGKAFIYSADYYYKEKQKKCYGAMIRKNGFDIWYEFSHWSVFWSSNFTI